MIWRKLLIKIVDYDCSLKVFSLIFVSEARLVRLCMLVESGPEYQSSDTLAIIKFSLLSADLSVQV